MATAVVSGRVDSLARQKADAVIRKAGLTATDVIQNVWGVIAETGEIPEAILTDRENRGQDALVRLERFLASLPPADPAYAGWEDDDILAMRAHDLADHV